jgi:hypothetical protein
VAGYYEPGHAGVDVDHGADGFLGVRLAVDPGCDGVVDAEDVDFLWVNSQPSKLAGQVSLPCSRQLTKVLHQVFTLSSASGTGGGPTPALAKTTSAARPKVLLTSANKLLVSASFETSVTTAKNFVEPVFNASRERTLSSSFSLRRPLITTPSAPARTHTRAIAWWKVSRVMRLAGFETDLLLRFLSRRR